MLSRDATASSQLDRLLASEMCPSSSMAFLNAVKSCWSDKEAKPLILLEAIDKSNGKYAEEFSAAVDSLIVLLAKPVDGHGTLRASQELQDEGRCLEGGM